MSGVSISTGSRGLAVLFRALLLMLVPAMASGQSMQEVLGPGDTVRITAFRHPDLTTEARIAEDGKVNMPMIGAVALAGMTPAQASKRIAELLVRGDFLTHPQIDVAVLQARSRRVSVLGYVATPGRYTLDGSTARLTDLIAMAGGLQAVAADVAVVQRNREGRKESINVDLAAIVQGGDRTKDIELASGDSIFIPKAPMVYVYGEVMRGGSYRIEPGMTVMQAISVAGGVTPRGSERRTQLRRRGPDGKWKETDARPFDEVLADDVVHVRESLF